MIEDQGTIIVAPQSVAAASRITRFLAAIVVCLAGVCAYGQDRSKALEIEQSGIQPAIQVGRPIPSWWDVKIRSTALVEGRIEFQLFNGNRLLATATTEEMALTGPQQRIRVMLPPVSDDEQVDQLQVHAKFLGKRFNQDLGPHVLRVAISKSRTFMVLTATSRLTVRRSAQRDRISRRLAFESLATGMDDSVKTVSANLDPADFPQEPMGFCAYELVVLGGEEFRQLKKTQLEGLLAWIRAGGSLFVEPVDVLENYHIDFLRKLAASGPSGLVIQPDSKGRLIPGTIWNDDRLILLRNGLGRVVMHVDDEQPDESMETPAWREAAAFLWRLHADQVRMIRDKPSIQMSKLVPPQPAPQGWDQFQLSAGRLSLSLITSTTELLDWLMPDGVRMVPLWVLALILGSFVILIGPVDYVVLGRLRARKFTWITFPMATLLVTGLTVWITNRYMSSSETRRGLVVKDIGDDDSVVRTNRFELLFIANTRSVTTDVRKGVFTDLGKGRSISNHAQAAMMGQMARPRYSSGRSVEADRKTPRMTGRIPVEFTVTQDLSKWTPQLNRMFWIPGSDEESKIDWQALSDSIPDQMLQHRQLTGEAELQIRKQFGAKALVACITSQYGWAFNQQGDWRARNRGQFVSEDEWGGVYHQPQVPSDVQYQPELFRWIYQHSVAASFGLFTLTSQVGPNGGADLSDLPIMDASDTTQRLLIVILPQGDDFIVYRKLFRTPKAN